MLTPQLLSLPISIIQLPKMIKDQRGKLVSLHILSALYYGLATFGESNINEGRTEEGTWHCLSYT